jgi:hypothetical protein
LSDVLEELALRRAEGVLPHRGEDPAAPVEAARLAGARWVAGEGTVHAESRLLGFGVGALVRVGRGDSDAWRRADEREVDRLADAIARAERRAAAHAEPTMNGEVDDRTASIVLENGVRIEVQERRLAEVAAVLRFEGGAGEEPRNLHGMTALLATATAAACAAQSSRWSNGGAVDVRTTPFVEDDAWGVVLEAEGDQWRQLVELAAACARGTSASVDGIERGRRLLLARLDADHALAEWAARLISPDRPALTAPWGTRHSIRHIPGRVALDSWRRATDGRRTSFGVVGPVAVSQVVGMLARRAVGLRAALVYERIDPALEPGPDLIATRHDEDTARVVIAWTVTRAGLARDARRRGAAAFAHAARQVLDRRPGIRGLWADGGAFGEATWAAVAVDVEAAELERLDATVTGEVVAASDVQLQAAADARIAWSRGFANAPIAASRLLQDGVTIAEVDVDREVLAALAEARPRYAIGRRRQTDPSVARTR